MGSLGGAWLAAVAGLGGMRDHGGALTFAPRLPAALRGLTFRLTYLGRLLQVEVDHRRATYTCLEGAPLDIAHHGETVTVGPDSPVSRPVPALPPRDRPAQPPGREPIRRGP
jgi:alpha,alpha-trehalose phosphorylase